AYPVPGAGAAVLYRDLDATAASLNAQSRGDGDRWKAFASPFLDSFEAVRATMLSGFPPVTGPLRLLADAGPVQALQFGRLLPTSAVSLGRPLFESGGARAWLYGAAMHGDAPVLKPGSAIAGFYLNLLGHAVGWP